MSILLTTTCNTFIILKLQIIKKKYLKIPKMPEGDIFFLAFNLRVSKKSFFSSKSYGLVVNEECEKIFLTEASKSYQLR